VADRTLPHALTTRDSGIIVQPLSEPVGIRTGELQDVRMMGQPVQERGSQAFVSEDFILPLSWNVLLGEDNPATL
jgi:hypothetical protein